MGKFENCCCWCNLKRGVKTIWIIVIIIFVLEILAFTLPLFIETGSLKMLRILRLVPGEFFDMTLRFIALLILYCCTSVKRCRDNLKYFVTGLWLLSLIVLMFTSFFALFKLSEEDELDEDQKKFYKVFFTVKLIIQSVLDVCIMFILWGYTNDDSIYQEQEETGEKPEKEGGEVELITNNYV